MTLTPKPPRKDAEAAARFAALHAEAQALNAYMGVRTDAVERPGNGTRTHSHAKNCVALCLGYLERLTRLFPVGSDR